MRQFLHPFPGLDSYPNHRDYILVSGTKLNLNLINYERALSKPIDLIVSKFYSAIFYIRFFCLHHHLMYFGYSNILYPEQDSLDIEEKILILAQK